MIQPVIQTAKTAMSRARLGRPSLAALRIANQRDSTVVWNRRTGHPNYNI
jgi:glycerol kinase